MCGVLLPVQYIITGNRYWLLSLDVVSVGLSLLGEINRSNFEGVVSMRTVYIGLSYLGRIWVSHTVNGCKYGGKTDLRLVSDHLACHYRSTPYNA